MKEQPNELKALRGALARAAVAVFTFAALTAWPLLADIQMGEQAAAHVARVIEQGNTSIHGDTSCRI